MNDPRFRKIYDRLLREYGQQRWWPVTPRGGTTPRYSGGPRDDRERFEVAVGAVHTQNTAWANAARAIERLNEIGAMSPAAIAGMEEASLAASIRSAGYYNQKAKRLRTIAAYFLAGAERSRESLLALNGVGPETADSILLYAWGRRFFVVDAYTRRMFGRLGLVAPRASYDEIRLSFEGNLPRRSRLYQEYHALIVAHGKRICKKIPICKKCLLKNLCAVYLSISKRTQAAIIG